MQNIDDKNYKEEMFCPGRYIIFAWYAIALMLGFSGIGILYTLLYNPKSYENIYVYLLFLILSLMFISVIFFILLSPIVYVNKFGGYFRIGERRIPFNDISFVRYGYGLFKPYKYSIFATVFYFVLKDGQRVRFFTYFADLEDNVISKLKDMNFSVKHVKFKNL